MITGVIKSLSPHKFPEECSHCVIDNYVHEIELIEVFRFTFQYESELSAKLQVWAHDLSGVWVRNHAVCDIKYHTLIDPNTFWATCSVRTKLLGKDATYFNLKWRNEWK